MIRLHVAYEGRRCSGNSNLSCAEEVVQLDGTSPRKMLSSFSSLQRYRSFLRDGIDCMEARSGCQRRLQVDSPSCVDGTVRMLDSLACA
jgi:hypothetical protein